MGNWTVDLGKDPKLENGYADDHYVSFHGQQAVQSLMDESEIQESDENVGFTVYEKQDPVAKCLALMHYKLPRYES